MKYLIAIVLSIVSHHLFAAGLTVGKMVVKVQDAATGKPLVGVYVYREITTYYRPFLAHNGKTYTHSDYAISNNEGIVTFLEKNVPRKKLTEGIAWVALDVNWDCDKKYDPNNVLEYERAIGMSWQDGGGIFSKNQKNDALRLRLGKNNPYEKNHYKVTQSVKPRREFIQYLVDYNSHESSKTIIIKLGNDSLGENGIKTEVALEEEPVK